MEDSGYASSMEWDDEAQEMRRAWRRKAPGSDARTRKALQETPDEEMAALEEEVPELEDLLCSWCEKEPSETLVTAHDGVVFAPPGRPSCLGCYENLLKRDKRKEESERDGAPPERDRLLGTDDEIRQKTGEMIASLAVSARADGEGSKETEDTGGEDEDGEEPAWSDQGTTGLDGALALPDDLDAEQYHFECAAKFCARGGTHPANRVPREREACYECVQRRAREIMEEVGAAEAGLFPRPPSVPPPRTPGEQEEGRPATDDWDMTDMDPLLAVQVAGVASYNRHDLGGGNIPETVIFCCFFWRRNKCRWGGRCNFVHQIPKRIKKAARQGQTTLLCERISLYGECRHMNAGEHP